ncbi:hypothetical protein BABINDRAFT_161105 [Babjeviella inositovora NRRL Y-12698]|uniref:Pre-mRNA-splicing factor CWC15 n=1 Tax=Babjeviella inositovora NRRL Y-12698 TaxID=984486 RepID=A0A1E3QT66_9ASCO|nr:uncharacterized protein BABINDRAFT_161105 [Babjeviella inositovora NRRL Y-12698]ODQ80117.1 hypothetical protein BABINDRAFT_161105 [Babjeviella inositovora NRRL Y-12698]
MTTAHRPTLESKRGKDITIANTIQHGRSQPAHKQLKLRQSYLRNKGTRVDAEAARTKVEQLKWELVNQEKSHYLKEGRVWQEDRFAQKTQLALTGSEENYEAKRRKVEEEFKAADGYQDSPKVFEYESSTESEDEDEDEESGDEESGDEDEDDTLALLRELEKIKAEKLQAKMLAEQEEQRVKALTSNPLLVAEEAKPKSSWRLNTVFNAKQSAKTDGHDKYVNDMLRSDFHRKFMDRYTK